MTDGVHLCECAPSFFPSGPRFFGRPLYLRTPEKTEGVQHARRTLSDIATRPPALSWYPTNTTTAQPKKI